MVVSVNNLWSQVDVPMSLMIYDLKVLNIYKTKSQNIKYLYKVWLILENCMIKDIER